MKNFNKIIFLGLQQTNQKQIYAVFSQYYKSAPIHLKKLFSINSEKLLSTIEENEIYLNYLHENIFDFRKLKEIKESFPNALFILNTKPMIDWVEDTLKDLIVNHKKSRKDLEINFSQAQSYIHNRNLYYQTCLYIFKDSKNFMILDVRQKDFFDLIGEKINKNINQNINNELIYTNKIETKTINQEDLDKIDKIKKQINEKYGYNSQNCLFLDPKMNNSLLRVKNNFINRYCFLIYIENSNNAFEELKLMLASFRKNVRSLSDSVFFIYINGTDFEESKIQYLKNNFSPIEIEVIHNVLEIDKVFTGSQTYRKYNALIKFKKYNEFDRTILMDSNLLFLEDFGILLSSDSADITGNIAENNRLIKNIKDLYMEEFYLHKNEIQEISKKWNNQLNEKKLNSIFDLPHFNSGFINFSKKGLIFAKLYITEFLNSIYSNQKYIANLGLECKLRETIALSGLICSKIKNFAISNIQFSEDTVFYLVKSEYGDANYGGAIKVNLPQKVLIEIENIQKFESIKNNLLIMESNKIYRMGDVLYRRHKWRMERSVIFKQQKYKKTLIYKYLSKIQNYLQENPGDYRKVDRCYGLECPKDFLDSIEENLVYYKKYITNDDKILYVYIRAGDVIDLEKQELYIQNPEKLYTRIKDKLKNYKSIKKIKIVTAFHFGDCPENHEKYQYKFSNTALNKNINAIYDIIQYIKNNFCRDVEIEKYNENEIDEFNIDKDFYVLSYAKHVIMEEFGGFSDLIMDARNLIKTRETTENLKPKVYQNNVINRKAIYGGFFSSCSFILNKIIQNIQQTNDISNLVIKEFYLYDKNENLYEIIFKKHKDKNLNLNVEGFTNNAKDIWYTKKDNNQYKTLVKDWFTPQDNIEILSGILKEQMNIHTEETICTYYRGTDTELEDRTTWYNVYVDNVKKIIKNKKNIKKVFLQTDDKMFLDYFMSSDIELDIVTNPYLEPIYSYKGAHFQIQENKILHVQKMLASVLLMSKCKVVVCCSSNVARWIHLYRKNSEDFYQFRKNQIFPSIE